MKRNIYQKLHDACLSAGSVKKGTKANGMHFNPLLHDDVQTTATQAQLDTGLYATCNYLTEIVPNYKKVMVVCTMRIYDVDDPTQHILVDGCSSFGDISMFGTGQAMSYSRKYAFLNLLNLKTGIKDEDGYNAVPFEQNSVEQSIEEPTYMDDSIDVEAMMDAFRNTKSLKDFESVNEQYKNDIQFLIKNNLSAYKQVSNAAGVHKTKLENKMVSKS